MAFYAKVFERFVPDKAALLVFTDLELNANVALVGAGIGWTVVGFGIPALLACVGFSPLGPVAGARKFFQANICHGA